MKVSLNWVKQFIDFELPPLDELVAKIGAQLGAVEEVIDLGATYKGIIIAKVVSCEDHPNADRLHVCTIDDGGKAQNVERDENGHVQVVCGAPNVRAGLLVAWLPPGATVPSSFNNDPFVLDTRELRGVKSNGMLASPHELALSDNHDGILEVDIADAHPGDDFASIYELDDYVIDIENKMFTHRPDCFGQLGVAREIAGLLGQKFTSPEWYQAVQADAFQQPGQSLSLPLRVENQLSEEVPRFMAIAMSGVHAGAQSSIKMQARLMKVGVRPISAVVDITNYMMMLTGQPLHAYDYDKVKSLSNGEATLVVRRPNQGEKMTLLGGKQIEPRSEAIMIATDKVLIGIGGVMGGAETEVDENTTNIILECANFDMYSIRRTSMAHGLFTDAVARFNKGQSPLQNDRILAKTASLVAKLAGGQVASELVDQHGTLPELAAVNTTPEFINSRSGLQLSVKDIQTLLSNVEFQVSTTEGENSFTAPFWRTDIEIQEDLVEEVGRLYGFDKVPLVLPMRSTMPATRNQKLELCRDARDALSRAGANEVLTYNFVHENLLDKVGQDKQQAFRLSNALSPDLQYFRLSLTPSLLEKAHPNIKAGYDQFALFEINKVHNKTQLDEDGLPHEFTHIALVATANDKTAHTEKAGAPYYTARKYLVELLAGAMMNLEFKPLSEANFAGHQLTEQMAKPFDKNRAAVLLKKDNIVGVVGEYRAGVLRALKLPAHSAGFEIFASALAAKDHTIYTQLPRFPKVEQDICLKVAADMPYDKVFQFVWNHLSENRPDATYHTLSAVDIYQREDDAEHKQITLRISLASYERTLTDAEVNVLLDHVASAASSEIDAARV